jgi:hypothetical protein
MPPFHKFVVSLQRLYARSYIPCEVSKYRLMTSIAYNIRLLVLGEPVSNSMIVAVA